MVQDKRKYTQEFFSVELNNIRSKIEFIKLLYNDSDDLYLTRKKLICDNYLIFSNKKARNK